MTISIIFSLLFSSQISIIFIRQHIDIWNSGHICWTMPSVYISMVFQYWTNWRKCDFKAWCWEDEPYSRFNNVDVYFVDVVIWCNIRTPIYSRQLYVMREGEREVKSTWEIFYECACLSTFFFVFLPVMCFSLWYISWELLCVSWG